MQNHEQELKRLFVHDMRKPIAHDINQLNRLYFIVFLIFLKSIQKIKIIDFIVRGIC